MREGMGIQSAACIQARGRGRIKLLGKMKGWGNLKCSSKIWMQFVIYWLTSFCCQYTSFTSKELDGIWKKKWTQSQSSRKGNYAVLTQASYFFLSFFLPFSLSLNFHIDHEPSHLAKCKWIMSNVLFVKFRKFFVVRIEIGPVIDEEMNCILRLPVGPVGRVV